MRTRFVGLLVATTTLFGALVDAQTYQIVDFYQGDDFFNEWTFFNYPDPTNGNVNYLDLQDAQNDNLAYVLANNTLVLAVDSTSSVPPGGNRNSVRMTSNNAYTEGLFIMDAAAMPVGCGVWPSFWTNGPNWPDSGEVDIVEGVNNQLNNQMTVHSGPDDTSCMVYNSGFTGQILNNDCTSTPSADSGCSIADTASGNSFGYGFNEVGGGVFAFLWDTTGMNMWHFERQSIPGDIDSQQPTPSQWGAPAGTWSSDTCNSLTNGDFYDHQMIIDTTICGGWAGGAYGSSGCPGTCQDIVADASNFVDAQWIINYVAVYQLQ